MYYIILLFNKEKVNAVDIVDKSNLYGDNVTNDQVISKFIELFQSQKCKHSIRFLKKFCENNLKNIIWSEHATSEKLLHAKNFETLINEHNKVFLTLLSTVTNLKLDCRVLSKNLYVEKNDCVVIIDLLFNANFYSFA
ncbi:hypothetical protein COBT_000681 [Conglomerata obtusa]